jgi:hypothetical protein
MRAILAGLILLCSAPAVAADRQGAEGRGLAIEGPPALAGPVSPHRNEQAQAAAEARGCWRDCQTGCKSEFLACGYERPGAECLHLADRCDRACQRSCRATGNPLLDWPRPWD